MDTKSNKILKFFKINELIIMNNSLNEVCNGFHIHNFEEKIVLSETPGPTRSACNVVEWNPQTCNMRGRSFWKC